MSDPTESSAAEPGAELEPALELAELSRLLRAELDWHRITGSLALPPGELEEAPAPDL